MTRVFGVDYQFLSCGDVFTQGLVHAAEALGVTYDHADFNTPNLHLKIAAFRPDLLFVVHGRKFIKRWNKPAAPHSAVWLVDEPYEVDETSKWSPLFNTQFLCDASTIGRHPCGVYLPTCYDPVVHTPGPVADKPWDVVSRPHAVGFIGGGNHTRDRYLAALADRGLLTYVIGGPWNTRSVQQLCRSGNIPAKDTPDWYRSTRIVLNVFRETHHYNARKEPATALNPRVFEALACGALVVSEWRPEVERIVPSLPTFRSADECVSLITELLANPDQAETLRKECAAQIAPHTYETRLREVLRACKLKVAA